MSIAASTTYRTCSICDIKFQSLQGNRKYCSPYCTKVAGRILSKPKRRPNGEYQPPFELARCTVCKVPYATQCPQNPMCQACRKNQTHSLAKAPVMLPPDPEDAQLDRLLEAQELACVRCAYWVLTPGAELGYSCELSQYMRCKPYRPGSLPLKLKT